MHYCFYFYIDIRDDVMGYTLHIKPTQFFLELYGVSHDGKLTGPDSIFNGNYSKPVDTIMGHTRPVDILITEIKKFLRYLKMENKATLIEVDDNSVECNFPEKDDAKLVTYTFTYTEPYNHLVELPGTPPEMPPEMDIDKVSESRVTE